MERNRCKLLTWRRSYQIIVCVMDSAGSAMYDGFCVLYRRIRQHTTKLPASIEPSSATAAHRPPYIEGALYHGSSLSDIPHHNVSRKAVGQYSADDIRFAAHTACATSHHGQAKQKPRIAKVFFCWTAKLRMRASNHSTAKTISPARSPETRSLSFLTPLVRIAGMR